mgnify:CR=1 FL=1
MNYWPRWINAITNATAHLSLVEMGAYDRLLDHYYKAEVPLPASLDDCCRIVRAMSKQEREAVARVLREFFTLGETGHANERADAEIVEGRKRIEVAQANGKRGGRRPGSAKKPNGVPVDNPPGNPPGNPAGSQQEPGGQAHHPHPHMGGSSPTGEDPPQGGGSPAAAVCKALKPLGFSPMTMNPSHPRLVALIAAGATVHEFLAMAPKALDANEPFAYLLSAVENERKRAAQTATQLHRGLMPNKQQAVEDRNRAIAAEWAAGGS